MHHARSLPTRNKELAAGCSVVSRLGDNQPSSPAACYTATMSDTVSQSSPQPDIGELRHTLSVHDVGAPLVAAGVPRSHRQIIRYCETATLDAVKVPGPTGAQWLCHQRHYRKRSAISNSGKHSEHDKARRSRKRPALSRLKNQAPATPTLRAMARSSQGRR